MDYQLFIFLIPELKIHIISQHIHLIKIFSQVNHEYKHLLKNQYINILGRLKIRKYEQTRIKQAVKGSLYKKNYDGDRRSYLVKITYKSLIQDRYKICLYEFFYDPSGFTSKKVSPFKIQNALNYYDTVFCHDLLIRYHVYTKRLGCMEINPNYAKESILSYLNLTEADSVNTNIEIVNLYIFLIMNKYVFNIEDDSDLIKLQNIEDNRDNIHCDIKRLFQLIRNKILAL